MQTFQLAREARKQSRFSGKFPDSQMLVTNSHSFHVLFVLCVKPPEQVGRSISGPGQETLGEDVWQAWGRLDRVPQLDASWEPQALFLRLLQVHFVWWWCGRPVGGKHEFRDGWQQAADVGQRRAHSASDSLCFALWGKWGWKVTLKASLSFS